MDKIKMAIIGAGLWGENHAKIYNAHPLAEVAAVCDLDVAKARGVAERQRIPKVYGDYMEMLKACPEIDAFAIVTPDFAHADAAVACAEHGKHILIEKPIATTREDSFRILKAVREHGVRAMVDLHNRWSPPFHSAWQAIRDGKLGEVQGAYYRLNDCKWVATDMLPWAAKSSILWFLGSHSLDSLNWLMGSRAKRVYAVSSSGVLKGLGVDVVDQYLSTIEFENGKIAQMENGWITPNANPCVNDIKFTITGTKAMITIDASNHTLMQQYGDDKMFVPDIMVKTNIFGAPFGFAFESIRSFVDCLASGEEFHVTLKEAAEATLGLLAVKQSAETRMPVEVDYGGL